MQLTYRAYNKTGQSVSQTIEAASSAEALERLRSQGLFVASLTAAPSKLERSAVLADEARSKHRLGRTRRLRHLAMFSRQMTVLLRSGLTVAESLHAVQRQSDSAAWRAVVADIRQRVERGSSISDAMAQHDDCFDGIYRGMIRAGEATGDLPAMFDRLAGLTVKHVQARSAALGAMVYPALLICVATVVFNIVTLCVVPRFGELFKSLEVPLPSTTAALLAFSLFVRANWWLILLCLAGLGVGLALAARTRAGVRLRHALVLKLPLVGKLIKGFTTARILRLLGVLMEARVPALEALQLARGAVKNYLYVELLDRVHGGVAQGMTIASGLSNTDLIAPAALEALRSAEISGQMGPMLTSFSDFMDEENGIRLKVLTSIMEPVILLVMGVMVALLAVSMFLPLFDLTAMTGGKQ
jgi:type II secretory pathway component PulF